MSRRLYVERTIGGEIMTYRRSVIVAMTACVLLFAETPLGQARGPGFAGVAPAQHPGVQGGPFAGGHQASLPPSNHAPARWAFPLPDNPVPIRPLIFTKAWRRAHEIEPNKTRGHVSVSAGSCSSCRGHIVFSLDDRFIRSFVLRHSSGSLQFG